MNRAGLAGLVVASVGWGSLSITTSIALRGFGPWSLLTVETGCAALVLRVACRMISVTPARPTARLAVIVALEPVSAFVLFNLALRTTTSGHAGLLLGSEAIIAVGLGMIVGRERPTMMSLAGVGLGALGVALLTWQRGPGGAPIAIGDVLVLMDAAIAATYLLLVSKWLQDTVPLAVASAQFTYGFFAVAPMAVLAWAAGWDAIPSAPGLGPTAAAIATGLFGIAAPFAVYTWALRRVSITAAASAIPLTPLSALVMSVAVLGETSTTRTFVGAALILAGLLGQRGPTNAPRHADPRTHKPYRTPPGHERLAPPACRALGTARDEMA